MKIKILVSTIVINLFLGYLWILFINHVVDVVNKLNNTFIVSGIIIVTGTALMGIIVKRVTNDFKVTHLIKWTGIISFFLVVFIHVFVVNLV